MVTPLPGAELCTWSRARLTAEVSEGPLARPWQSCASTELLLLDLKRRVLGASNRPKAQWGLASGPPGAQRPATPTEDTRALGRPA